MSAHIRDVNSSQPQLLVARSPFALVSGVLAFLALAIAGSLNVQLAVAALAWGAFAFPLVWASWRFQNPVSWLLWAIPVPAVAALIFIKHSVLVAVPVAMFHLLAGGMLGFFSLLWLFRAYVQRPSS
jgi:hypothetical protein